MIAQDYWHIFLETGAPELYLLYSMTRKLEETHVSDCTSIGSESSSVQ